MFPTSFKRRSPSGDLPYREISLSTRLVLQAARDQGVTITYIPYTGLFTLTYRGETRYVHAQLPSLNTRTAAYCCNDKAVTKALLRREHLHVPKGYLIRKSDPPAHHREIFDALTKPLVVKPTNSSLANNVYTNLTSWRAFSHALKAIYASYGEQAQDLLVEEMSTGTEYRILATRQRVVSIIARLPAHVVGDGKHTIQELVAIKNAQPWRGGEYELHPLTLAAPERRFLREHGWQPESIPPAHTQVFLAPKSTRNISRGGDTVDVTSQVHPSVRRLALRAIRAIPELEWAGIDYFSTDITKPQTAHNYIILEINTSPNIAWQEFPASGQRRQIAQAYLQVVFPSLRPQTKSTGKTLPPLHSHLPHPELRARVLPVDIGT